MIITLRSARVRNISIAIIVVGVLAITAAFFAAHLTRSAAAEQSNVPTNLTFTKVSDFCGISAERAYCWGDNQQGNLGDGTYGLPTGVYPGSDEAVAVDRTGVLGEKTVTDISSNGFAGRACAVADGKAYCWGNGDDAELNGGAYGFLGDGLEHDAGSPVAVDTTGVLAGKTVTKISVGYDHTCVIANGQAYCWGNSPWGGLGNGRGDSILNNGNTDDRGEFRSTVPTAVTTVGVLAGKTVTDIEASDGNTCAIADGKPYCWGEGQILHPTWNSPDWNYEPVTIDPSGVLEGKTVTSVSVFKLTTCVVADGTVYCKNNVSLENGYQPDTNFDLVPVSTGTVLEGKIVSSVQVTRKKACATSENHIYCWEYNANSVPLNAPVDIDAQAVLVNKDISSFSAGDSAGVAIGNVVADGDLYNYVQEDELLVTPARIEAPGLTFTSVEDTDAPGTIVVDPADASSREVRLKGTNFRPGMTVEIDGEEIANTRSSQNEVIVDIDTNVSETTQLSLRLANVNGDTYSKNNILTLRVGAPEIESISPNTSYSNSSANIEVEITGNYFESDATVLIGSIPLTITEQSLTSIKGYFSFPEPQADTVLDVTVTNPLGGTTVLSNAFVQRAIPAKTVTSVQPFTDEQGLKHLIITGTGLFGLNDTETMNAFTSSVVTLNGQPLKFCARDTLLAVLNTAGLYPGQYTSEAPCYFTYDFDVTSILISGTRVDLLVPDDFPASGTVSVNDSNIFAFGEGSQPSILPTIELSQQPLVDNTVIPKRPTFTGTATPGATVKIVVYSDPVTCITTADQDGNWSCTLPSDLEPGMHTVYVTFLDDDGNETGQLGPYIVRVDGIAASTVNAPNTGVQRQTFLLPTLAAATAGVLALLAALYVRQRRA